MGGYNLIGDTKNSYHTEGKLREDIAVLMGGRAAEEVILGEVNTLKGIFLVGRNNKFPDNHSCFVGFSWLIKRPRESDRDS